MLQTYRDVFRAPGAALFSATGAFARLPLSMTGLGIVLLVAQRTGSYGVAGTIAAMYVLVASIAGPLQARLADRVGQAPVLWIAGGLHAIGIALVLVFVTSPVPLPHLAAAVAGLGAPQAGTLVRARWAHVLDDRSRLNTAFAVEAVLDEAVFVIGPVLVTVLTLQVADVSGLLTSAGLSTLASWGLALQRRSEPPVAPSGQRSHEPLGVSALWPLTVAGAGVGVLFGSTEVVVVAFTDEAGRDDLAGLVLAIWAVGSLLAGLVVGALPSADPLRRFRLALLGLTVLFVPLPFVDGVGVLALGMLAAGLMVSPTLIAMTRLVEIAVPTGRFTEGLAWATTGLAAGVALGAAAVGLVVDGHGASAGFGVPLAAVAVATVIAWTVVSSPAVAAPGTDYGGSHDE